MQNSRSDSCLELFYLRRNTLRYSALRPFTPAIAVRSQRSASDTASNQGGRRAAWRTRRSEIAGRLWAAISGGSRESDK